MSESNGRKELNYTMGVLVLVREGRLGWEVLRCLHKVHAEVRSDENSSELQRDGIMHLEN